MNETLKSKRNINQSMMKKIHVFAWLAPLSAYLIYFSIKLLIATYYGGAGVFLFGLGYSTIMIALVMFSFSIARHPLGQVIVSGLLLVVGVLFILVSIGAEFKAFNLTFIVACYTLAWCVHAIHDGIKNWKRSLQKWKRLNLKEKHLPTLIIIAMVVSSVLVIEINKNTSRSPISFTISDERASNYDLVLYYPDKTKINDTFCEILAEANVSTVSFPMREHEFENGTVDSEIAANATRIAKSHGIKVEVWPLFNHDEGTYPSISEIDRFEELYYTFENWTVRNNITVDYLLWDIESGGEITVNYSKYDAWPSFLRVYGIFGGYGAKLMNVSRTWPAAVNKILNLAKLARDDGHVVRMTTHTIIWDVFDGDGDEQMIDGIPAWDTSDAYEYISMMSYRGCEYGGNSDPAWIYEHVRASSVTQKKKIAICLGCLNYNPYGTIESVVNDVYLALAAGADSIRLFQGNSWVEGVGKNEATGVLGNPAHGLNGTDGLLQLLKACKQGGNVTYYPKTSIEWDLFWNILSDVKLDLAKPF
ncbi:MAG: hypothetical protein ACTSXU_00095 [Promethearchaeota archaeon]